MLLFLDSGMEQIPTNKLVFIHYFPAVSDNPACNQH